MLLIVVGLHVAVSFPAVVLLGPCARTSLRAEQADGRPVGCGATPSGTCWPWRFGLVMFVGLYWLIWLAGAYWWLVAAGAFFVVSVVLGQLAPVLILPLFYKIERLDEPELAERIARLAEGTGLSIEGVYRMDLSEETVKANAMLAGLGRTRRVLLGDTLLGPVHARRDRSHLRPRDRAPRVSPHPQDDRGRAALQRGGLLDLRPAAGRLGRRTGGTSGLRPTAGRHAAAVDADPDACSPCCSSRCKTRSAAATSGSATATRWSAPG